jgi:putative transcriptional regulator
MDVTVNTRFRSLLDKKSETEKRDISLAEVAKATGISRQALYKWQNNKLERIELNSINRLCRYFSVQISDLFEYIEDETPPKKKK